MTLQSKILLSILSLTLLSNVLIIWLSQNPVGSVIAESVIHGAIAEATKLSESAVKGFQSKNESLLLPLLQATQQLTGATYVMALDPSGLVLAHSNVAKKGKAYRDPVTLSLLRSARPEVQIYETGHALMMEVCAPVWTHLNQDPGERFLFKIQDGSEIKRRLGVVRLGIPLRKMQERERKVIHQLTGIVLSVGCLAILVAVWLMRSILTPVRLLVQSTVRISQGDYSVQVPVTSGDELGNLAQSFNRMCHVLAVTTVSKEFLDSVLACMLDPLLVIDSQGHLRMLNSAALRLLRYSEEEVLDKPADLLFQEKDSGLVRVGRDHDAIPEELLKNRELHFLTKKGEAIPILYSRALLKDKEGRVTGMIGVAKDITERKAAEEQLAQSNRELQEFASIASHDLQEPLRKVQVFGDRLITKCANELPEEGRDCLERMQKAVLRMQSLINDLLMYARVTTKAQPFVPVDLGKIAQEIICDLEVRLEEVKGHIDMGTLPTLEADPVQIRQLLQNLLGNALKFHQKDVPPHVKIYAENVFNLPRPGGLLDLCHIFVEDNGIGFDPKYVDRIFKVFERLHGRDEYEGTGMGLAICRKIVERHGGTITAQSIPGKGTTFIVILPLKQSQRGISKCQTMDNVSRSL